MATTIYYRSCDNPRVLYRVVAASVPPAKGGGLDLSTAPAGMVAVFDGKKWNPVKDLPPVAPPDGDDKGCVRHTKNVAKVGV